MKAKDIAAKAAELISGDRAAAYGDMVATHDTVARLWSAYLAGGRDGPLCARDVAVMMVLLKVARTHASHKDDNYIDACGYAAIAGEIAARTLENQPS